MSQDTYGVGSAYPSVRPKQHCHKAMYALGMHHFSGLHSLVLQLNVCAALTFRQRSHLHRRWSGAQVECCTQHQHLACSSPPLNVARQPSLMTAGLAGGAWPSACAGRWRQCGIVWPELGAWGLQLWPNTGGHE